MAGLLSSGAQRAAQQSQGLLSGGRPQPAMVDPAGYWNQVGAWLPFGPGGGIAGNPMSAPPDRSGEARLLEFLAGSTPIVGEAMAARDAGRYGAEAYLRAQQGDYSGAASKLPGLALSGLGMLPFFGGMTREAGRLLSPKTMRIALENPNIPYTTVLRYPTQAQMETLAGKAKYGLLRWGDDAAGNRHVWPAFDEAHDPMAYQLGLDRLHYSGDGTWETGAPIPPSAAPK